MNPTDALTGLILHPSSEEEESKGGAESPLPSLAIPNAFMFMKSLERTAEHLKRIRTEEEKRRRHLFGDGGGKILIKESSLRH